MTCSVCSCKFCYLCGEDLSISGYKHFQEGESSCAGLLFDPEDILAWNGGDAAWVPAEIMNADNDLRRVEGVVACPYCGQDCFKVDRNNHMRCGSCTNMFCFLCKARLKKKGGGQHFVGGNCKQHS